MKKTKCFLAVLTLGMIATAGIGQAMAYFTTYAEAQGGYVINLGDKTEIKEKFDRWTKHISVTNYEGSEPVYVRVKAFCAKPFELVYSNGEGSTAWYDGNDGYWYCGEVVEAGKSTPVLDIKIENIPVKDENDPESGPQEGDTFNVIVVYESTPVRYDAAGNPSANWEEILEVKTEGGGN